MQDKNTDLDEKHESQMEEWRASHLVGRKVRKPQNGSG
jgi:hypothetical protein